MSRNRSRRKQRSLAVLNAGGSEVLAKKPPTGEQMPNPLSGGRAGYLSITGWDPMLSQNPDEVALARGGVYAYQEMTKNPYIKAALLAMKGEALQQKWDILAASDDPRDVEIADFVRHVIDPAGFDFTRDLWQMLDCIDVGHSITEKVWGECTEGRWKGMWRIVDFKSKDPSDYRILLDAYRNVVGITPRWAGLGGHVYPPQMAVIMSWMPRYENAYGEAALKSVRARYEFLTYTDKQLIKYVEQFGNPTKVGKCKNPNQKTAMLDAIKKVGDESAIVIDVEEDIDFKSPAGGGQALLEIKRMWAQEIAIGIAGAYKQMMEGSLSGSKADSEVHADSASIPSNLVWLLISSTINAQVIKEMVDYNFPGVEAYPTIARVIPDIPDNQVLLSLTYYMGIVEKALASGVDIGQKWFRDRFGFPVPEDGELLLEKKDSPITGGADDDEDPLGPDFGDDDEEDDEQDDEEDGMTKKLEARVKKGLSARVMRNRASARVLKLTAQGEAISRKAYAQIAEVYLAKLEDSVKKKG